MKKRNMVLSTILAGSILTLAGAGIASAESHRHCGYGSHGYHGHAGAMFEHGGMHRGGMHRMFKRLDLTEAQRDQMFKIMYAEMPAKHAKMKALREARQALRTAARSSTYDAKKVHTLAEAQGKAIADLIVMRTETFHKMLGVLTPKQREKLTQLETRHHKRFEGR